MNCEIVDLEEENDKDKLNAVIFDIYNLKYIKHVKVEG